MLDAALSLTAIIVLLSNHIPLGWRRIINALLLGSILLRELADVPSIAVPAIILVTVVFTIGLAIASTLHVRNKRCSTCCGEKTVQANRFKGLSQREQEVIGLLLAGKSQSEVAVSLELKPSTVGTYRRRAIEKLEVSSLDELRTNPITNIESNDSADKNWLPMAWGVLAGMILLARYGGLEMCSLISAMATIACVLLAPDPAREADVSLVSICAAAFFLTEGIILRALAVGFLSTWNGLIVLVVPITVAVAASQLQGYEIGKCALPKRTYAWIPLLVLGLCIGPMSPDVIRVTYLGIPIEWPSVLTIALITTTSAASVMTFLLMEEGSCQTLHCDRERGLHALQGRGLSELESAVLLEIAQGEKPARIAENLCIAKGTVNSYRFRGYKRLGIHTRLELIQLLDAGEK